MFRRCSLLSLFMNTNYGIYATAFSDCPRQRTQVVSSYQRITHNFVVHLLRTKNQSLVPKTFMQSHLFPVSFEILPNLHKTPAPSNMQVRVDKISSPPAYLRKGSYALDTVCWLTNDKQWALVYTVDRDETPFFVTFFPHEIQGSELYITPSKHAILFPLGN